MQVNLFILVLVPLVDAWKENQGPRGQESEEQERQERVRRGFYTSGAFLGKETSRTLDYLLYGSGYNR